ncbi:hypothetical protein A3Q34_06175 [Colwellia sp. PAMC 20917]|uniref:hypothetical protein n=1 Tax=Colwellia sp. PAMC 20917 TaxID=1816218 RepID=UPI000877E9D9|nr:hypothetical protein [Colwellia sp. PAMC 20917]AOW76481.1 hypothetical protein A3Q34_06175 [Colwellia sp. PAMC 20917]
MDKISVLVVVPHDAALNEYVSIFNSTTRFVPVFYLGYKSRYIQILEESNICYYTEHNDNKIKRNTFMTIKRVVVTKIKHFFDNSYLGCFLQSSVLKNYLTKKLKNKIIKRMVSLDSIVIRHKVLKVVIATDRSYGNEASVILLAKRKKLDIILMSFAYSADYKSVYKLRNALIYSFLRGQPSTVIFKSSSLGNKAFYRSFESCALKELGVLSSNPWVLGMGHCSKMLVDSEREKSRLVKLGGHKEKYVVTGLTTHDSLYSQFINKSTYKNKFKEEYSLNSDPNIFISLPQYFEHGLCEETEHFLIINQMIDILSKLDVNLFISLHPKMDKANYNHLDKKESVHILDEPLSSNLICADIFLATYSSTVTWALMCDIPVVIFDHINLAYDDFYSEFLIPLAINNDELLVKVKRILFESVSNDNLITSNIKNEISPFDGKCLNRIVKAISEE